MKILLLGDASNFHITLARALRNLGHNVTVASAGSMWMNTQRDIDLQRRPGHIGTIRYAYTLAREIPKMRGYDIVQVHNPFFLTLKPQKLRPVLAYLKRFNGKLVYEALGTDPNYVKACTECRLFRYSDFRIGWDQSPYAMANKKEELEWLKPSMVSYTNHFVDTVDGIIACLWEYYTTYQAIGYPKLAYGGIPIETADINYTPMSEAPEKVKMFIGIQRKRSMLKGTDVLLEAAQKIVAEMPELCELKIVENMPYSDYVKALEASHVMLDQIYSYTPATNALLAMARGMVAVSGAEPEFYRLIGETENHPIINIDPRSMSDVETKLRKIIENRANLPTMSRNSREFVIKHNDSITVAKRHLDFWEKL